MAVGRLETWAGCAILALACLALDMEQQCRKTEYKAHGKCCRRCPPGQRVTNLCTEDSETVCEPCQPEHFQGQWTKETGCIPHKYCDLNAGLVVQIQGSATQNTVCQCRNGSHCSSHECQTCRENTVCSPGKGVKQAATNTADTVCTECPVGFFSSISSAVAPCQPWSSCETTGLVHKTNGTRFSDVICEEAWRGHSPALVLVAVAAVVMVLGGVGFLLWRRRLHHKGLPKCEENPPEENEDEKEQEGWPTQETRSMAQEDGKDSHLAEQESA